MLHSPILSIIIPCYNSGNFIAQTIEMLLQQDLSDCEIVLVNDGSKDETLSILQKYEAKDNRIHIINQSNQGVSVARNNGIMASKGEYIYFLDSDDTITSGSIDHFKQMISTHPNCQMLAVGYCTSINGKKGKKYVYPNYNEQEFSGRIMLSAFLSKKFCVNICSSIYKRCFLIDNNLFFKEKLKIGEDILFLLKSMMIADKIYYSSRMSFIYLIRDNSAMQGYKSYSEEQYYSHTVLRKLLLPIAAADKEIRKNINFFLLFSYLSNLRYYLRSNIKSNILNKKFIADGSIRYQSNYTDNFPYWLAMKLTMLIPLKLILKIWKT